MKKLVILLFLLINCDFSHAPIQEREQPKKEINADFKKAYLHLRKWEGNYGWERYDAGGETYAGISRTYNPLWNGWIVLDYYKKSHKIIKHQLIQEMEFWVLDYYLTRWFNEGFDSLTNQEIATYLFDYRNSGPISYIHTRRVLVEMNYIISTDGMSDSRLIYILNSVNTESFLNKLRQMRMKYYVRSAKRHKGHINFLEGWLSRTYDI